VPLYGIRQERCAWAQFSLLCDSIEQRDGLVKTLKDKGVNVAIFYPIPLYKQNCFSNTNITPLPVTEKICGRVLNLPCYTHVADDEIKYIVEIIKNYLV
jgi:dTDP-4-amino-4,6-dideoxygalactose transaminase